MPLIVARPDGNASVIFAHGHENTLIGVSFKRRCTFHSIIVQPVLENSIISLSTFTSAVYSHSARRQGVPY